MRLIDATRARLRLLFSRRGAELRMEREFQFHIEMETDRLIQAHGLSPVEARRRALAAFGGVEKHKEALRDDRGFAWFPGLALNLKLGARMLVKYPGISIVGGLAMAIGVGLGAAYIEVMNDFLDPSLPFEEGDRIVGLQNWDQVENAPELRSGHDFLQWRDHLRSIRELAAFRSIERNIGPPDVLAEPIKGAEMTASAFFVTRVPPLLGRPLVEADEADGAPPVMVLGYEQWRNRFASDPAIVGRTVQLGRLSATVVGVMPDKFAFPVNHQFWIPLPSASLRQARREGPPIQIFGRLAPGLTLTQAQVELAALGARAAGDSPSTHEHLRPRVVKYPQLFVGTGGGTEAYLAQFFFVMLLLVLSSNVATMVFARTATREHEIAMRFALGSSRARILGQFFIEALVLALTAAAVGLMVVSRGADWITRLLWEVTQSQLPFWLNSGVRLNVSTVIYAIVLAVLGSFVAGVIPALKATRSRLQSSLRQAPGLGHSALRFGGLWGAMIVIQVAFAVIVLPPAIVAIASLADADHADPGFAASEYLSARLEMDAESSASPAAARDAAQEFESACAEFRRQLLSDPAISRVTLASRLPGMNHPEPGIIVEPADGAPGADDRMVMAAAVAPDYFDAFGAGIIAGRGFTTADLRSNRRIVIVNQYFADRILLDRNAVGRRIRYQTREGERAAVGHSQRLSRVEMLQPGEWYEIVGVVKNLGMDTTRDAFASGTGPGVYHLLTGAAMGAAGAYSVRMAFHVDGDAAALAPKVRALAHAVHPALRVYDVHPLDGPIDRTSQSQRRVGRFFSWTTALVAFIALLISVAGAYSVMSFTVARQTREIGIRIALGADRRRIIGGVFSRAMVQICTGVVIGAAVWLYVIVYLLGGNDRVGLLALTAAGLLVVGLLACGVPVSRALRIEPTEALRHVG